MCDASLAATGEAPLELGFSTLLEQPNGLGDILRRGDVVRLEPPDGDAGEVCALYRLGAAGVEAAGFTPLCEEALDDAVSRIGALGSPRQLAFGFEAAARRVADVAQKIGAETTFAADEIALAYDKTACLAHLRRLELSTPTPLGGAASFDEVVSVMRTAGAPRVFIKVRHGAAAAGMVALALGAQNAVAYATVSLENNGRLHATRRVRRLTRLGEIRAIVDGLAPLGLHLESWAPKAGIDGKICDLRMVVVGGDDVFATLRMGNSPMTNLRLGAKRADVDDLRSRMPPAHWRAIVDAALTAARGFPGLRSLGLDIAPLIDFRRHAILEVNAFGDFVKGALKGGQTPQERLLRRMLSQAQPRALAVGAGP